LFDNNVIDVMNEFNHTYDYYFRLPNKEYATTVIPMPPTPLAIPTIQNSRMLLLSLPQPPSFDDDFTSLFILVVLLFIVVTSNVDVGDEVVVDVNVDDGDTLILIGMGAGGGVATSEAGDWS
jgi:hypothetical protein